MILFEYFGHEIFGRVQMMLLGQVYQRGEISNVVKFIPSLPNSMAEGACTLLTVYNRTKFLFARFYVIIIVIHFHFSISLLELSGNSFLMLKFLTSKISLFAL